MFWKKFRPDGPARLTTRLAWWYAGSSLAVLLVTTGFLYFTLVRDFNQQNDRYLEGKLRVLQTLLRDVGDTGATLKWEVDEDLSEDPSVRIFSRVLAANGRTLFETEGMSRELPAQLFSAAESGIHGAEIKSPFGKTFRIMSGASLSRSGATRYRIELAIDTRYESDLLARYRNEIWGTLIAGILISILIGNRIARRGLQPLSEMATAVQRIRSSTLNERIRLVNPPAEIDSLAWNFNQTLDRLEEAFARLSRFSSDIAHELRTPISNIRGQMEVALARLRTPAEYADLTESCLEDCERLSRLIDSLLFLARAENPETEIRREPLDLARELKGLADFYEAAASERGIHLEMSAPQSCSAAVDRSLFQRAIGNLIENSLRYTPRGGRVCVRADENSHGVALCVTDSGIGIPEEHLSRVFDRFYRVDPARTGTGAQAGLGLAIVQTIARLHGGDATIQSTPGHGTSVTLVFR
jgi:two-component system heavy metal sensor histidine kinase CusS